MEPVISQIITPGGLNQKTTNELKKRYQIVNKGRLKRIENSLQMQQRQFLDLLPFLFHINHYLLPGWVDDDVPLGVHRYQPDKTVLAAVSNIARSYNYSGMNPLRRDILSLFLMGSTGTIAQSSASDLDVWCCYRPDLPAEAVYLLQQKATAISKWAESLSLEVHIFLMDAHKFKGGVSSAMSEEDSGSSQHFLLLDEFYRTGVLLAGAIPMWWLVHPQEEGNYSHEVKAIAKTGLLNYDESLDFGGMADLPPGEFVGAGLWQLYKGIESPYKSVLKLLAMEIYADGYPDGLLLSVDYKQAIFDFKIDLDELDPYVMLYRRIEKYLKNKGQIRRLELIRKCFYFKVNLPLTRRGRAKGGNWRRELLEQLVKEWGWQHSDLEHLDNRTGWSVDQVVKERRELIAELTHCYRYLTQFARRLRTDLKMRQDELLMLGRKLSAAFDRKAGKIEMVNPHAITDLRYEKITIHQLASRQGDDMLWGVFRNLLQVDPLNYPTPLKHANGLLEVLIWCYFNGMLDAHSNVPVFQADNGLSDYELKEIVTSMRHEFPKPLPSIPQDNFHSGAVPTKLALYVNVGADPLPYLSARGLQKISSRNDALDFSALRENLILTLDLVVVNSWNEVLVNRFDSGSDTMVQCLQFYLNQLAKLKGKSHPELAVYCFCASRPAAIANRVKELFEDISQCYFGEHSQSKTRYVLAIESSFYVFQLHNKLLSAVTLADEEALIKHLSIEQAEYSPIVLDRYALTDKPELRLILLNASSNHIRVFFRKLKETANVYIVDELGSFFSFKTPFHTQQTLISSLQRFLRLVEYCQNTDFPQGEPTSPSINRSLQFFEFMVGGPKEKPYLKPHKLDSTLSVANFHNAIAIVTRNDKGKLSFNIQIDDQEFDSLTEGDKLYTKVAEYLLGLRKGREKYPCYITELHFGDDIRNRLPYGRLQTLHYFQYKHLIEKSINNAMKAL